MSNRMAVMSSIAAVLTLGACASTSGTAPRARVAASPPVGCVGDTGSAIPARRGTCAGFGSTYTQDDIEHTGKTTIGAALRQLDPTLTVTR
jgi:hypothetical protein